MLSLHLSGCAREEPPASSLATELMSMSADDWAACLFAADAGRLSCPLLDCFASSASSGALLQSATCRRTRSLSSLLMLFGSLRFFPFTYQMVAKFPSFSCWDGCP